MTKNTTLDVILNLACHTILCALFFVETFKKICCYKILRKKISSENEEKGETFFKNSHTNFVFE